MKTFIAYLCYLLLLVIKSECRIFVRNCCEEKHLGRPRYRWWKWKLLIIFSYVMLCHISVTRKTSKQWGLKSKNYQFKKKLQATQETHSPDRIFLSNNVQAIEQNADNRQTMIDENYKENEQAKGPVFEYIMLCGLVGR